MSIVVWLLVRLGRRTRPTDLMVWIAVAVSTVLFAGAHLPQVSHFVAEPSTSLVVYVWVTNGLVGGVAGWLYWKRGILAASCVPDQGVRERLVVKCGSWTVSCVVRPPPIQVRARTG